MQERDLQYDFLEDGQILPTLYQWRSRLEEDVDAALSVCRHATEALRARRKSLEADAGSRVLALANALTVVQNGIRVAQNRIPRQKGIFFDTAERKGTFESTCLFLSDLQGALAELQALLTPPKPLQWELERHGLLCERTAGDLRTALEAANVSGLHEPACKLSLLLQGAEAEREACGALMRTVRAVRESGLALVQYASTAFVSRISVESDLEHEGESASPASVLRSMGELYDRIGQTARSILSAASLDPTQDPKGSE